ncbi:MAG: rRNA maturation RNase YbeY [Clostridiales bacterium]|nr:rRNA maturation RNase YbeY [Clostridiales bacterium]
MTLLIDDRQKKFKTDELEGLVKIAVENTIKHEGMKKKCEVSIIFIDNEEIKRINKNFRGIDKITDVLSFPQIEYKNNLMGSDIDNMDLNTGELVLGDIAISLDRAYEQSIEYGHSFEREVAYLTVHGMLHLLGFDHETESERRIMRKEEEDILAGIGLTR